MLRLLLLLAACAAPTAALPFGFGRRKGEVLASLHEIEADLADLETTPAETVVPNAPPCGELPAVTPPDPITELFESICKTQDAASSGAAHREGAGF